MGEILDPRSGIHLTGNDSGWPVDDTLGDPPPPESAEGFFRYSTGDGYDYAKADEYHDGVVYVNEQVELGFHADGGTVTIEVDTGDGPAQSTGDLDLPLTGPELVAAVEALPNVGAGNVVFANWPDMDNGPAEPRTPVFLLRFVGDLEHRELANPPVVVDYTNATFSGSGGAYVTVGWEAGSPG